MFIESLKQLKGFDNNILHNIYRDVLFLPNVYTSDNEAYDSERINKFHNRNIIYIYIYILMIMKILLMNRYVYNEYSLINNKYKRVCFIHSCTLNNGRSSDILYEILSLINIHGLMQQTDNIWVTKYDNIWGITLLCLFLYILLYCHFKSIYVVYMYAFVVIMLYS